MKQASNPLYGHPDTFPLTQWRAKGIEALDGDTISALVETEPRRFALLDLRLSTIDTYELHSGTAAQRLLGEQAKAYTQARIAGKFLRVISVLDTEKYGRTLTAVHYETATGNWLDLATRLRDAGFEKVRVSASRRRDVARSRLIFQRLLGRID
jgi:endonuclease YncB( thermonuclease family)